MPWVLKKENPSAFDFLREYNIIWWSPGDIYGWDGDAKNISRFLRGEEFSHSSFTKDHEIEGDEIVTKEEALNRF